MGSGRMAAAALVALVASIVVASVFAYYPLNIAVIPQAPPVVFEPGSNANQPDIGGKTIAVTIGANGTSASVSINPTYQETYYKDVLRIVNLGEQAVEVYLVFTSVSNTLPQGSIVKLFVYEEDTEVRELDITSPPVNAPVLLGRLGGGVSWQLDLYVYIPEGASIGGAQYAASARLAYTPSPAREYVHVLISPSVALMAYDGRYAYAWTRTITAAPWMILLIYDVHTETLRAFNIFVNWVYQLNPYIAVVDDEKVIRLDGFTITPLYKVPVKQAVLDGDHVYAMYVYEVFDEEDGSYTTILRIARLPAEPAVESYNVQAVEILNFLPFIWGPTYIVVDETGAYIFYFEYGTCTSAVLALDKDTLTPLKAVQFEVQPPPSLIEGAIEWECSYYILYVAGDDERLYVTGGIEIYVETEDGERFSNDYLVVATLDKETMEVAWAKMLVVEKFWDMSLGVLGGRLYVVYCDSNRLYVLELDAETGDVLARYAVKSPLLEEYTIYGAYLLSIHVEDDAINIATLFGTIEEGGVIVWDKNLGASLPLPLARAPSEVLEPTSLPVSYDDAAVSVAEVQVEYQFVEITVEPLAIEMVEVEPVAEVRVYRYRA